MSSPTNPMYSQVDGGADAGNAAKGGFFSKIGAALKNIGPYIVPAANRLAAAAGNYGPLEEEHRQRQEALSTQLAQSNMENQALNRQLLSKQIENVRTPEEASALHVKQTGEEEAARAANAPGTVTAVPGEGQFRVKGTTATPIMIPEQQVPNPTQAPNAGMPPSTMPPLVKPSPTVTEAPRQLPAPMMKPISSGGSVEPDDSSPTGFSKVWRGADFHELHREPTPAPSAYVGSTSSGENTVLKDTPLGQVPVTLPHSTTKTPVPPRGTSVAPQTKPAVPGGPTPQQPVSPRASLGGVHAGAPILHSSKENDWMQWEDASGKTIAGSAKEAIQSGAQNARKVPAQEVRDITNARMAVRLMTKQGNPQQPETNGVIQLVDALDRDGKLGVLASRWNSWMTTGVGTSPGDDPRIITLIDKNMLGDTATMLAHFGASGGRSPQMLQHFLDLANARKMDGPTLKAGLLAMADYMGDRAMMPGSSQPTSNFGPPQQVKSFGQWRQSQYP